MEVALAASPYTPTGFAVSAALVAVRVIGVVRVTLRTMAHQCLAALNIQNGWNWLHMSGVHTSTITAQMVNGQPDWDGSDQGFIRPTMRQYDLCGPEGAVALCVSSGSPKPAAIWRGLINLLPESLGFGALITAVFDRPVGQQPAVVGVANATRVHGEPTGWDRTNWGGSLDTSHVDKNTTNGKVVVGVTQ